MKSNLKKLIKEEISKLFESNSIKTQKGTVIKRSSKYGVGKYIGGNIYIHKDYETVLPQDKLEKAKVLIGDYDYQIVKYDEKNDKFTFIKSPDFNSAEEPTIESYVIAYPDGKTVEKTNRRQIYHHKWLFVDDNYSGFNVEDSKNRSRNWLSIPNINFSKIGNKSYWEQNIIPLLK